MLSLLDQALFFKSVKSTAHFSKVMQKYGKSKSSVILISKKSLNYSCLVTKIDLVKASWSKLQDKENRQLTLNLVTFIQ